MSHLKKKVLGTGAALVALSAFVPNPFMIGDALAQATASSVLNISAAVVNPLGVTSVTDLKFGGFAVSKTAGKLNFPASGGAATITNGVIITAGALGQVTFKAPKSAVFTVSIADLGGANAITLGIAGATTTSKTLKVTQLTLNATPKMTLAAGLAGNSATIKNAATAVTAKLNTGTKGKASIGGILNFKPNNIVGIYTGTYTVLATF